MLVITPERVDLSLCHNIARSEDVKLFMPRPSCSLFKNVAYVPSNMLMELITIQCTACM